LDWINSPSKSTTSYFCLDTKVPKSQDCIYILVSVIAACFHAMKTANIIRLLRITFIKGLALIAYTAQNTQATKQTLADISKVDP
jgi:hypothetical protein